MLLLAEQKRNDKHRFAEQRSRDVECSNNTDKIENTQIQIREPDIQTKNHIHSKKNLHNMHDKEFQNKTGRRFSKIIRTGSNADSNVEEISLIDTGATKQRDKPLDTKSRSRILFQVDGMRPTESLNRNAKISKTQLWQTSSKSIFKKLIAKLKLIDSQASEADRPD